MKKDLMKMFGLKCSPCWKIEVRESDRKSFDSDAEYEVIIRYSLLGRLAIIPLAILGGIIAFWEEVIESIDSDFRYCKKDYCSESYNITLYNKIKKDLDK